MIGRLFFFIGAAILGSTAAADPIPDDLVKVIKTMRVSDSTLDGGVLRVVMGLDMVGPEVYRLFVNSACTRVMLDPKKAWGTAKINRMEIVNSIAAQGFAFDGGRKECQDLGGFISGTPKEQAYLDQHTLPCRAGICRR